MHCLLIYFLHFLNHSISILDNIKRKDFQKKEFVELNRIIFGTAFSILKESVKNEDKFNRHMFDSALQIINNIFENLRPGVSVTFKTLPL